MSELLWKAFGPRVPRIELVKLRNVDFFPTLPDLENMTTICIGSKTRTIGDALMLSTLPAKLKAKYPRLKVATYPRGYNPVVFFGNPHVTAVSYMPGKLYGDDCNAGSGHLIQIKERFFGLPVSDSPKPEIHLLPNEMQELPSSQLPVCIIHPWGKTHAHVLTPIFWERAVNEWKSRYAFWQVGLEGQPRIPGCERYFLLPKPYPNARKLFAVMTKAKCFAGVDSGPMHVARAFGIPSFVFSNYGVEPQKLFRLRHETPFAQNKNLLHGFLYEANEHVDVTLSSPETVAKSLDNFLARS